MSLKSDFLQLKGSDFLKGAILAVIVPTLVAVQQALQNPPIVWKQIAITAIGTFIGYLIKNLLTNSTAAAVKTVENAGGTVTTNYTAPKVAQGGGAQDW